MLEPSGSTPREFEIELNISGSLPKAFDREQQKAGHLTTLS